MKTEIVEITPKMARTWLDKYNTKNRRINSNRVRQYARDMENGNWLETGDAVRFNGDSTLLDGQHRLSAIVLSDTPIKTVVTRGIASVAQMVMDTGGRRTFADHLCILGVGDYTLAAGVCNTLLTLGDPTGRQHAADLFQLEKIFTAHETTILEACSAVKKKTMYAPASRIGGIYVIGRLYNKTPHAKSFVETWATGVPSYKGDPAHLLRERIIEHKRKKLLPSQQVVAWSIYRCWEAHKENTPMGKFPWCVTAPTMPKNYATKVLMK